MVLPATSKHVFEVYSRLNFDFILPSHVSCIDRKMMLKTERKSGKLFNKAVFKFFDKFISEDEEIRLKGASELVSFLTIGSDDDGEDKVGSV